MHVFLLILTIFMSDGHTLHVRVLQENSMETCKAHADKAYKLLPGAVLESDAGLVISGVDARCEDVPEVKGV